MCCYPKSSTLELQLTAKFRGWGTSSVVVELKSSLIHLFAEFIVKTYWVNGMELNCAFWCLTVLMQWMKSVMIFV